MFKFTEPTLILPTRTVNFIFVSSAENGGTGCHGCSVQRTDRDQSSVVQRQLDAYNARDVDAILATYAEDAQQFEHPAKLMASGTAELRERFVARFKEPNLHAQLLNRTVMGPIVIDHEEVTRTFPEGPGKIQLIAIYEVQAGKIAKAWFMSGPKTLH